MSTFTPNKDLIEPANGSFNNIWDEPLALNWTSIDASFGGNTAINVTGVSAGTYALLLAQYQPPNIAFSGTIGGNLMYVLPAGVGGIWTVLNNTSGAFTLQIGVSGGSAVAVLQGLRSLIVSDGSSVGLADTSAAAQAQANAQAFATSADVVVATNANTFATAAANAAQAAAIATSANASNLSSGTVPNAQLPNVGVMPGVIIQADPGGTPSGPPGTIWFYY